MHRAARAIRRHGLLRLGAASTCLCLWGGAVEIVAAGPNITRGCVEHFNAAADYFPDKVVVEDSATFTVAYRHSYKVVTVTSPEQGSRPERYVLVQCGTPVPVLSGELSGAQVVTVPVTSMFAFSTTHSALLVDLGRTDVLTGVSRFEPGTSPAIDARVRAGLVVEFARRGLVIDAERVVASQPSLVMTSGGVNATLAVIRAAHIPVVANIEWREPTALGRAEWLKYMALFLNEEDRAQALYSEIKEKYGRLRALAAAIPASERPLVMTGRSTRGVFSISGGRSYVAALIADAGGRYAWTDNLSTGSALVDFEAQLQRAAYADVWINGSGWTSLADMLRDEPRYAAFKAYRDGRVWTYERRQTAAGVNDYWTRSVAHPDLVLADLVEIFHPGLLPDRPFEWYMPLPPR